LEEKKVTPSAANNGDSTKVGITTPASPFLALMRAAANSDPAVGKQRKRKEGDRGQLGASVPSLFLRSLPLQPPTP